MFELTYIHHDCFLLSTPECALIFDYWKDPEVPSGDVPAFIKELPGEIPLYVFVSHFHKDHFNKEIFGWIDRHPSIRFILSKDTARHARHILREGTLYRGPRPDISSVTILKKGESFADTILKVDAFGSTDEGNSYAVTLLSSRLKVFHAGDLNCWTWRDESTAQEIADAENAFRGELMPIAEAFPQFDIAMFPVDSRIGSGYAEGAAEFVRTVQVKHFFPMHFELADSEEERVKRKMDARNFNLYAADKGEYIALTSRGDKFRGECGVTLTPDLVTPDKSESLSSTLPKLKSVLTREFFLSAGETNAEREISLPLLTSKLIDIATEHANHLGIGNPSMPNDHCGWVLSRLTIEMHNYPKIDTVYRLSTWVESWNRHFSERAFCIEDSEGNPLGYARSVWMVLDTVTHANAGLLSLQMQEELISSRECPIKRQGKHLILLPPDEKEGVAGRTIPADGEINHHTFLYSDLDAYRHVNTVRYVALLMNQFSLEEHDEYMIGRMELSFLHEGQYGKSIDILRAKITADEEDSKGYAFQLRMTADKSPILFSRLWLDKRSSPIPSL